MEGPAEEQVRVRGTFVLDSQSFQNFRRGFIVPPYAGLYSLFEFLPAFIGIFRLRAV
jgi:hypothetical protein